MYRMAELFHKNRWLHRQRGWEKGNLFFYHKAWSPYIQWAQAEYMDWNSEISSWRKTLKTFLEFVPSCFSLTVMLFFPIKFSIYLNFFLFPHSQVSHGPETVRTRAIYMSLKQKLASMETAHQWHGSGDKGSTQTVEPYSSSLYWGEKQARNTKEWTLFKNSPHTIKPFLLITTFVHWGSSIHHATWDDPFTWTIGKSGAWGWRQTFEEKNLSG